MNEIWLEIKDEPGYEVSNLGNVRNKKTGRGLKPRLNRPNGYLRVVINSHEKYVHRLVAGTFYDGDHEKDRVKHADGDRLNNTLPNLQWAGEEKEPNEQYDDYFLYEDYDDCD